MKYAVTAASGQLGRLVVDDLLSHVPASEIVAIARTPSKLAELAVRGVDVRAGDYDDPGGLRTALDGVDTALLISGWDIGRRVQQHANVIEAAREAGVTRLAYTSSMDWGFDNPIIQEHRGTEEILQSGGMEWTILRDHLYMEPYEIEVEIAAKTGADRTSVEGVGAAFTTRRDIARCASTILRGTSHGSTVYNLTGPDAVTPDDFAAVASEIRGRPVVVEDITRDQLGEDYRSRGMEDHLVDLSVKLEDAIRSGALAEVTNDVELLLGEPGTSFRDHMLAAVGPRL